MEWFADVEADVLVNEGLVLQAVGRAVGERLGKLRLELLRRMQADKATELVTKNGVVKVKETGSSYDQSRLDTLLEYLEQEELVEAGALTLEHEKTESVPRAWNVTKLRAFGKRGEAIQKVINGARIAGTLSAQLEHRKPSPEKVNP